MVCIIHFSSNLCFIYHKSTKKYKNPDKKQSVQKFVCNPMDFFIIPQVGLQKICRITKKSVHAWNMSENRCKTETEAGDTLLGIVIGISIVVCVHLPLVQG